MTDGTLKTRAAHTATWLDLTGIVGPGKGSFEMVVGEAAVNRRQPFQLLQIGLAR